MYLKQTLKTNIKNTEKLKKIKKDCVIKERKGEREKYCVLKREK